MPNTGPFTETGSSGLNIIAGGYVQEEFLPSLTGRQAITVYKEMRDNDPVVGAILFAIDMLLRQVDWTVEAGDDETDDKAVEFLEQCMEDMSSSWGDVISEIMSMLVFGWSYHEIVYKRRQGPQPEGSKTPSSKFNDGKIGWRKLPMRAQETLDHWKFGDDGGIEAMVQKPPPMYQDVEIPIQKSLLFRTTTYKNNPEGKSALRNAYRPWYFKKRIEEIEGVGIERDLAGFPVGWLPPAMIAATEGTLVTQRKAWETALSNIRRDKQEYMLLPLEYDERGNKVYDFTLMNSGGARTFDTDKIIQRYNQNIAMTVLADFILLGHEKVGSFALSSDKTDLFAVALGTYLDIIEDVFNRFAVPRLFSLNGMDQEHLPQIKHGDIEQPDLAAIATYISTLVNAGVPLFPDEDLESWLRRIASMPEQGEDAKEMRQAKVDAQQAGYGQDYSGGGGDFGGGGNGPGDGTGTGNQPGDQQAGAPGLNGSRGGAGQGVPAGGG